MSLPFLLEIGTEEIPDWMIPDALENLRLLFEKLAIPHESITMDATPRRLVLRADGLPARQADSEERVMGPAKSAPAQAVAGFARKQGVAAVLRGIRAISDYEYEFQMALMNRRLAPEIETVFLQPAGRYSFVSSRMLKEVFSFGGDVSGLVPPNVLKRLRGRIGGS